ncbi:centrosomal protein of 162 kDa-like [Gigantopelta aegis]|uniref:centrosomal protein of 162 kDa-like n=1 Tax=Gigantopelta aegis TaxID=1735272 RepID=UPI001B88CCDB|nr:centrosomal protein of 162 kDa-like [Gigantopelta aegis]
MSKKLSKKQLDSEFEAFLRQSVSSDESVEIPAHKKTPDLWWIDDSDQDDVSKIGKGKSFLKSKKPVGEKKKTEPKQKEKLKTDTSPKLKTNQDKGKPRSKLEVPPKRNRNRPDVSMSKDSLEDISEKSEEHELDGKRSAVTDASLDRHRDTADGFGDGQDPGRSTDPGKVGMDTLEENADKQRFFKDLEEEGTVDYGQLNQEMSRTEFGLSPGGVAAATTAAGSIGVF